VEDTGNGVAREEGYSQALF